jgi:hypothetical protein
MDMFLANSDIQGIHTRQGSDLHYPTYTLVKVQKGVFYTGIKIFNNDINKLKYALKTFLQMGYFYSLDEYFEWKTRDDCVSYKQ